MFYYLLSKSWRKKVFVPDSVKERLHQGTPIIFAHWHGDELAIIHLTKIMRIATMTSTSRDGEIMDRVLRMLGAKTSRGSSTRGGVGALKGLVRLGQSGRNPSMAVDGPKGPLHEVKPGVFELARLLKAPIIATGVAASPKHVFHRAWNKTYLPLPFARVSIHFDIAIPEIRREHDVKSPELARELKAAIFNASQHAAQSIAP